MYKRQVKAGAVSQVPGQVHDSSASGSTLFVEPRSVLTMGNKLAELESRIRDEERKVLAELSALVAEEASALNQLVAVLRTLDLALARGRYGRWLGGVAPQLEPAAQAPFSLKGLRHPLLVWQHKRADGPPVVPISVEVSPELRVVAIVSRARSARALSRAVARAVPSLGSVPAPTSSSSTRAGEPPR